MRKQPTASQKRAILKRSGGKCENKWCRDEEGPFEYDHRIAVKKGGGNNLGNWKYLCVDCHRPKTRRDNMDIRKLKRLEDKRLGRTPVKRKAKIQSPGFDKRFRKKMNGETVRREE